MRIASIIFLSGVLQISSLHAQSIKGKLETALNSLPHPQSISDFSALFHLPSVNQDSTLVCWSFATSSFIESEMKRLGKSPIRLSVMFPVYYNFVEKAKRFILSHGESRFQAGDLFSGVLDIFEQYGAVPAEAYEGIKSDRIFFNHNTLYAKLDSVMHQAKFEGRWDSESIITKVKTILNVHLGVPPDRFWYRAKEYNPKSFLKKVVDVSIEQYIFVTSFRYASFYQYIELNVPDNWNQNARYFNVPLDLFYRSLVHAVTLGYSAAIDMDNSEQSYRMTKQYAFIPEYDVPKDSITQIKREMLFQSGATTDDHLVHIVSSHTFGTEDWFLVKDSWRTAWEGPNHGYFFLHESYIKLKVLSFLVHRDAVPEITRLLH